MTRKKVTMAYIPGDVARKASFRKRKQGLMKKMEELNTLCDVHSFLIIYGPEQREPTVWPSRAVAEELLERFMNVSDVERGRKMTDHYNYLKERIRKSRELLAKHARRNRELQVFQFMNELQWTGKQFTDFSSGDLNELVWFVEMKRREIAKRRNLSQYASDGIGPSSPIPMLDNLAPLSSPELEIYLPQVGIMGEDEEIDVPESSSGLDKPEAEASRPPGVSSGMEDLLFIPPSSRVDTGAGLINNHDALEWDHWLSNIMNATSKTQAANGDGIGGGDGLQDMDVELPGEIAGGTIPGDNESGYAFVGQDGDTGGGDNVQPNHQAGSGDQAGFGGGFGLPDQLSFEDNNYLQNSLFIALQSNVMKGGTGGGIGNTIDDEPTNNPGSSIDWPYYL